MFRHWVVRRMPPPPSVSSGARRYVGLAGPPVLTAVRVESA